MYSLYMASKRINIIRKELMKYKENISDDEKKLIMLLRNAEAQNHLLDEKDMAKHDLK